jgi:hypothetical protein
MQPTQADLFASDPELAADLREATRALERALQAPTLEVQLEASSAEKMIVHARNDLIDSLRKDPGAPECHAWKALLEQLNAALSLIIGIEYPSNFVRREKITQAKTYLEEILAEGFSSSP